MSPSEEMRWFLEAAGKPIYPSGNIAIPEAALAMLGEQIAIAAAHATDINGKKMIVRGDMSVLVNLAASVVGQWLHTGVYIEFTPTN
jgi:hypothetical protein